MYEGGAIDFNVRFIKLLPSKMLSSTIVRNLRGAATARKAAVRCYTEWPMLNEEHIMISDMAKNFAQTELAAIASKTDQQHLYPADAVKKLGELGIMGMNVSPDFGGAGMDTLCYAIAMEEISRVCASTGVIVSAHNSLYCAPVNKFGNKEQKDKFLTPW